MKAEDGSSSRLQPAHAPVMWVKSLDAMATRAESAPDDAPRTMSKRVILGSSSKWRQALWKQHFPNESSAFLSPDIDEKAIRHASADTLTLLIANAKADALASSLLADDPSADALLICLDQVVRVNGTIREKPESAAEAREFLSSYADGALAECVNGIVVHDLQSGARCGANEIATVSFAPSLRDDIESAIDLGDIFTSAGAFSIDYFDRHVRSVIGSREAIIGLPVDTVRKLLKDTTNLASRSTTVPLPLPSAMVAGVDIRPLKPSDEPQAKALFAAGMRETVGGGLRSELLRFDAVRWSLALAVIACVVAAFHALFALPQAIGFALLLFALLVGSLVLHVPRYYADKYVEKSLADDMRDITAHYMTPRTSCFFVAVDAISDEVIGTVAIEHAPSSNLDQPANETGEFRWKQGDAELRRMSVATWARGKGVAQALFAALKRFVEQTEGYERIVLSTSTLQGDAHERLYPKLGFQTEWRAAFFGKVEVSFFAMDLVGKKEVEMAAMVASLKPHFYCKPPTTGAAPLFGGRRLPLGLRMMWEAGSEWHLLPDGEHYNVFGFNLWRSDEEELERATLTVFGDAEGRKDWAVHHGKGDQVTCAAPGWICCMAVSEFDYLFVNLNEGSGFGEVRWVVNNCFEEHALCSMDELVRHLYEFVKEGGRIGHLNWFGFFANVRES